MSTHLAMPRIRTFINTVTRRSQTGILIFVNRAPIIWYSKRQNAVEVSTFGSEITAMKNAIELIEAVRYKLRMFGVPIDGATITAMKNAIELIEALRYKLRMFSVPIDGATNIFCDNEAVTKNCSNPTSTVKKKHNSIAYHRNREAFAAGTCCITKEDTETNLSDLVTKKLGHYKREGLLDKFTY